MQYITGNRGTTLFYEPITGTYFRSTVDNITSMVGRINNKLTKDWFKIFPEYERTDILDWISDELNLGIRTEFYDEVVSSIERPMRLDCAMELYAHEHYEEPCICIYWILYRTK